MYFDEELQAYVDTETGAIVYSEVNNNETLVRPETDITLRDDPSVKYFDIYARSNSANYTQPMTIVSHDVIEHNENLGDFSREDWNFAR